MKKYKDFQFNMKTERKNICFANCLNITVNLEL